MARARSTTQQSRSQNGTSSGSRILEDVWGLAETLFRNRRELGAEKLQAIAEATREYANSMNTLPKISEQISAVSDSMEEFSEYMTTTDLEQMVTDAGNYARERPIATMGVALVLGLVATRFFMPTQDSRRSNRGGTRSSSVRARARRGGRRSSGRSSGTNGSAQAEA